MRVQTLDTEQVASDLSYKNQVANHLSDAIFSITTLAGLPRAPLCSMKLEFVNVAFMTARRSPSLR